MVGLIDGMLERGLKLEQEAIILREMAGIKR
jgi:hypothetical protein